MKIGFLGGGNIARAIISGLLKKNFKSENIFVSDIDEKKILLLKNKFKIKQADINFFKEIDIIFLSVKPKSLLKLLENIKKNIKKKHLIISVVAGIPIEKISKILLTNQVIRAMPNTTSSICEGITALYANLKFINKIHINIIEKIFYSIGDLIWIKEEYIIDIIGTISGSGPAYVYRFIEAIVDGAVYLGLNRKIATKLILKTILGSVKTLLENDKENPRLLSDKVTSPGGTTITALNVMEKYGFSISIHEGLKQAYIKSIELSKLEE